MTKRSRKASRKPKAKRSGKPKREVKRDSRGIPVSFVKRQQAEEKKRQARIKTTKPKRMKLPPGLPPPALREPYERRTRELEKPLIKGAKQSRGFSFRGNGKLTGGGVLTVRYPNDGSKAIERAAKLLLRYKKHLSFFQVRRNWKVSYKGASGKRHRKVGIGYSPMIKPSSLRDLKRAMWLVKNALANTAVSAAKDIGLTGKYEGSIPQGVTKHEKGFDLILWFNGKQRRFFLG